MDTLIDQMTSKNTPQLRFPEFSDGWEKKKLGDLLEFKNGINASKEQYGSGYKFINVLDILNNEFLTHDKILGSVNVSKDIVDRYPVNYGDILFQRSSETREDVGSACVYLDTDNTATFGGFVIRGRKMGDYNPIFLNKLLKTDSARDSITAKSGGSTRYNVGQETLSSVDLLFPSLLEQQKIASFLTAVDDKIQALKKKKSLLEQYKKGVMQKIFSQELRFKDTSTSLSASDNAKEFPKWEVRKLGEISNIKTGKLDANAMVDNGEYRFYTCAKEYYRINKYAFDTEALLISGNGANVGYVHYYKGKFNAYQRTYVLDNFNENIIYVRYFLDKFLFDRISTEKKEGNTPYIVLSTLADMVILLPSLREQTKIANFLSAIDEKINLVSGQIEKMEVWKKGLLQQMFV